LKKLSGQAPYVTKEVYDESKAHPAIIHYLGEERPWRKRNTHPYRKEYKTYLSKTQWADTPDETGWGLYFFCFRIFNFVTKPFPSLRYRIIDSLIPAFQRRRAKKIKKENAQKDRLSS
jgi:lipopolysaccharide biosynthesis glycosyltransferase